MKNALLIAALTITSASAFASKARMNALQNSKHLLDTQTVFQNPADIMQLPDHVSVEWGNGTANTSGLASGTAEGGFIRSMDDMKWGVYFGRKSDFTTGYRYNPFKFSDDTTLDVTTSKLRFGAAGTSATQFDGTNGGIFQGQDNPLELFWGMKGDINYGASLSYSDSKVTRTVGNVTVASGNLVEASQQSMGLRLGAKTDVWDAYVNLGLASKANTRAETSFSGLGDVSAEYKGDTSAKIGGSYTMDSMYYHLSYATDGAKIEETTTSVTSNKEGNNRSGQTITLGAINQNPFEGGQFFYGASLVNTTLKHELINVNNADTDDRTFKAASMRLPVLAGVEFDAASWLTVRGAVSQDLPFSTSKLETTLGSAPTTTTYANNKTNTAVSAGVGMKFGKLTFDGFLRGSNLTGGRFGSDDHFLANGSVTYLF